MLIQLKSGHTIEISLDTYLDMSDEEIQNLECLSPGQLMQINNPFFKPYCEKEEKEETEEKDKTSNYELHNVSDHEKLKELYDYDKEDT